ncbi:MAG: hypothetical protein BWY65_00841 [Firmicutes bacterium ADurb.Bin373]|nr:MAG: hypothetical protein BWY65_00841 [Firmicutes bacterium ADurb.Bin373]
MKDRKKLLETKLELNDQQLENVGGAGWPRDPNQLYYCLCNECGWRSNKVSWDETFKLETEHRLQTGHRDIRVF